MTLTAMLTTSHASSLRTRLSPRSSPAQMIQTRTSAENLRRLRAATDQDGALRIVELPMPGPVVFENRRLPASYANFYVANGIVLVPVFNDPNDRFALEILAGLFPGREVVGIYSGDLIWGFGAMHCMTQQQPAVRL